MPRYFLFYKPYQVLSQFSAEGDKKTLADYFADIPKDIYPAGRLDYDSEGLLLLTNDKQLTHRLLEPRFAHARTYYVQVEGLAEATALQKLCDGVDISIDGKQYRTQKAIVTLLPEAPALPDRDPPIRFRKNIPTSWISVTLSEGKNRQVRRMTAAVGLPTLRLVRAAIGSVQLEQLQPGQYRELTTAQTSGLLKPISGRGNR
jgi:23S rRNA pseudouridine2457 synthase